MNKLPIIVTQPLSGSRWEGNLYEESSVMDLKEKLEEELEIPVLMQNLLDGDKELDNMDRLPSTSGGELQLNLVTTIEPALKQLDTVKTYEKIRALEALAMVRGSCNDVGLARLIDNTVPPAWMCLFHSNETVRAVTLEIIVQVARKGDPGVVTALLSLIVSHVGKPPLIDALENLVADVDKAAILAEKARLIDCTNETRYAAVQALASATDAALSQMATKALEMEQIRRNDPRGYKGGGKGGKSTDTVVGPPPPTKAYKGGGKGGNVTDTVVGPPPPTKGYKGGGKAVGPPPPTKGGKCDKDGKGRG